MACIHVITSYYDGAQLYQFEVCDTIQMLTHVALDFPPNQVDSDLVHARVCYL